jgi:hypothetical protein
MSAMSISICWQPREKTPRRLNGTARQFAALELVFGNAGGKVLLEDGHLPILNTVIEKIESTGRIEIWAEW